MKIIDFHTHIYPPKVAPKAVSSVGTFYNLAMHGSGTADDLIELGNSCGVSKYVILPVAVTGKHVEGINDFIVSECEKHDEFTGFGTMHIDYEDKLGEAERIKKMGLHGIKLHPDTQQFNMDAPEMFEVYDFLQQNGMTLIVHAGDYRYDFSHPKRLKRLSELFPKLTLIGAHFGGWSVFDLAYEYLKDTNCYLDTSSSFAMIGAQRAEQLINAYGAERMVFGSDFPMWNAADELKYFEKMNLTDEQRELIFHKNAEKILKL